MFKHVKNIEKFPGEKKIMYTGDLDSCEYTNCVGLLGIVPPQGCEAILMSDREPTRWQHNRIYPHPISPCVYTYDSRLYCCETVDANCSYIMKS